MNFFDLWPKSCQEPAIPIMCFVFVETLMHSRVACSIGWPRPATRRLSCSVKDTISILFNGGLLCLGCCGHSPQEQHLVQETRGGIGVRGHNTSKHPFTSYWRTEGGGLLQRKTLTPSSPLWIKIRCIINRKLQFYSWHYHYRTRCNILWIFVWSLVCTQTAMLGERQKATTLQGEPIPV